MGYLMVSQRIKSIVNEIEWDVLADIGCDHGFTPIHALETGKIKSAIACDLNTGPIFRAMRNITVFGDSKIQIRQGFGLEMLLPGEADTIVISGMGGMLTIEILERGSNVLKSVKQLILQPQRDIPEVRRFLHRIGFMIKNEVMLKEDGKFYNILNCRNGCDAEYSESDYIMGKILKQQRDPVLAEHIKNEIKMLERVREKIESCEEKSGMADNSAKKRLNEVHSLLNMYKEMEACR